MMHLDNKNVCPIDRKVRYMGYCEHCEFYLPPEPNEDARCYIHLDKKGAKNGRVK